MSLIAALEICANTAFYFGVAPGALSFADRRALWSHADDARAVAVLLVRRRLPGLRREDLGRLLDIPACNRASALTRIRADTEARLARDPLLRRAVEEIEAELDLMAAARAAALQAPPSAQPEIGRAHP